MDASFVWERECEILLCDHLTTPSMITLSQKLWEVELTEEADSEEQLIRILKAFLTALVY